MAAPDPPPTPLAGRADLVVDLGAIARNVARLRRVVAPAQLMSVVKADGYGHGLVETARAARSGGADWLGVAVLEEALELRASGDEGPVLAWLAVPGEDYRPAVEAHVDLTAYSVAEVAAIAAAAREVGVPARLQLKADTGLSRGGAPLDRWADLVDAALAATRDGAARVTGLWSHLACSDEPDHPANDAQERAFRAALAVAEERGLRPGVRHLANSGAALLRPSAHFDLVRCGIATYGLSPAPDVVSSAELGLEPAMTVRSRLAMVKRLPAGAGVSYGHTWHAAVPTTVGVVPLGYGDGVLRHASSTAEVWVRGRRRPVRGQVCMDQFVVELDDDAETGDEVTLFSAGTRGEPTAQDWAEACGTISYEIVTRMGGRLRRRHVAPGAGEGVAQEGAAP